jgi:spore coat polysaccharide biosynthesis protein SpsF
MLKTLGIVDACCTQGSPTSKAARRLGGKSVLEWVVRRVTDAQQLDGVIVVTPNTHEHRLVASLAPPDVPVFVGRHSDALGCLAAALEDYQTEAVVRIRAGCLFIDPMFIDRLVVTAEAHPECDYLSYCCRDGRPAILSPVGVFAEWFRTSALRRAARKAAPGMDREDPTRYIYSHPEKFNIRLLPAPARIDRDDVRLTVDFEEDWDHALAIFDALGFEEFDWRRIANLLDHQPALRRRMAALNRAHTGG